MTVRIVINGLGRIGRCVMRALVKENYQDIEIIAANGPADIDTHIHLLKYDSIHGRFPHVEKIDEGTIKLGDKKVKIFSKRCKPEELPWQELDIDVVLECTGIFKKHSDAMGYIRAGARKVLISAPCSDADNTIVYGVNNDSLKEEDKIISVGSCTTNCLAPIAKTIENALGIESGFVTTIHAYTNDQNLIDNSHKDLQRARAAAMSMIPTSTGAAKAIGQVLPSLKGKLDGVAIRVPTANVSLLDFKFTSNKPASVESINNAFINASKTDFKGIIAVTDEPLVSIDFLGNKNSAIIDLNGTKVINDKFCRITAWYDNEWGFSCRMLDVAKLLFNS